MGIRLLVIASLVALALGLAAPAKAEIVRVEDDEGRPLTFDVRAPGVDVAWYAALLRSAAHGDEIGEVTVRLVPAAGLRSTCGAEAGGCYGRGVIVVPAERTATTAHALIHEYGHHLDHSYGVRGVPEPNGVPAWWHLRKMGERLAAGEVAADYSLGWTRGISEIFAEDYTQLHLQTPYKIGWLAPPSERLLVGLRRVLGGPAEPAPPPAGDPLVIVRRGTLAPGERRVLPFGLLGPGRRVTFTARVEGVGEGGTRARMELVCGRRVTVDLRSGDRSRTIDVRDLGPGRCAVALTSSARRPHAYLARLRLAVEGERRGHAE